MRNWKSHLLTFAIVFVAMALFARGCRPTTSPPPPTEDWRVTGGPMDPVHAPYSYVVHAEIADTEEARKAGLTGRKGLRPGYGMIYVYDPPARPQFDWQYMQFPVSAAFAREDGTIVHIRPADGPTSYTPDEPVQYVLEVRAGWFADRKLASGTRLERAAAERDAGRDAEWESPEPAGSEHAPVREGSPPA
jgi:uncharacterized membrane protein (UPF0127 family)